MPVGRGSILCAGLGFALVTASTVPAQEALINAGANLAAALTGGGYRRGTRQADRAAGWHGAGA